MKHGHPSPALVTLALCSAFFGLTVWMVAAAHQSGGLYLTEEPGRAALAKLPHVPENPETT